MPIPLLAVVFGGALTGALTARHAHRARTALEQRVTGNWHLVGANAGALASSGAGGALPSGRVQESFGEPLSAGGSTAFAAPAVTATSAQLPAQVTASPRGIATSLAPAPEVTAPLPQVGPPSAQGMFNAPQTAPPQAPVYAPPHGFVRSAPGLTIQSPFPAYGRPPTAYAQKPYPFRRFT